MSEVTTVFQSSRLHSEHVQDATSTTSSCSICLEELYYPADTNCGHTFCTECILKYCWRHDGYPKPCPICRRNVMPLLCSDELSNALVYDLDTQGRGVMDMIALHQHQQRARPICSKLFSLMLILTLLMFCLFGTAFFRDYESFWV